ncbi:ABC transporter ATP-binding protein [Rhodococcus sp. 06-156-3C]|nr:ABC transporter ATP-binding protein [Rhodococcus sp. 06-156-4a]OZD18117.1 ABC transporter ATP-binding protein [Rhodococcus sp. 06-156-3C]OZD20730.1 ABC transporter ATP-binding protein [Rhodococcus sp. 06-156-4C]OZD32675.1 ABC transporter ATP-binding protein [Rhodococcus sp. 06-156-3]
MPSLTMHEKETMPTMSQPATSESANISGVRKTFNAKGRSVNAVDGIDLDIKKGEYVVILGPSGCGKSTLLRCLAGLETPTEGTITLQNKTVYDARRNIDIKPNNREVGMVFQSYALWPHMSIEDNVAYPLKMRKVPKVERAKRVAEVLEVLECSALAKRLPAELSGGQQQRVALARALVYEPSILLLDEPLSNLDALLRVSLRTELLRLHRTLGFTALHITHDQDEALEMGDRVVLMREGRIEQMGAPEDVYARPVSPYAAHFLGVRNQAAVTVTGGVLSSDAGPVLGSERLATQHADGSELTLFARGQDTDVMAFNAAEEHTPAPGRAALEGTLAQSVLGEGGRRQYIVDVHGHQWIAHSSLTDDLQAGDRVLVTVPIDSVLLYEGEKLVSPAAG